METDLSSLLESIKDEKSQIAIAKVFDEFKLLTLGKSKMDVAESMEIKEYCNKRTDLEIPNDKLTPEQLAWKHIYFLVDEQIVEIIGKEKKDELDNLKAQMSQLDLMTQDVEELLPLGREIEELLIRQNSYLSVHFDSNRYKENEDKMSADMLADSTPNHTRVEIAKAIIAMVDKYKGIMIKPLFDHQDKIYEALSKFSSIYQQMPFAIARHEAAVAKLENLYGEWLSLTEDLYRERLKIITGLRNLIELDAVVPQHIIKTNGNIRSGMPTGDFAEKYAPASVLVKEGLSRENEISNKRNPLSLEMLGEPDTYIKLKPNEMGDNEDKFGDEIERAAEEKYKMSNIISDCFKQFKKITIIFYAVICSMGIVGLIHEALMPFAFWGYVIMLFYYWTNLWSCAKLVGKSPLGWVIISGILSFIGPVVAYNSLRSSAVSQGFIMEHKPIKPIK